MTRVRGRPLAVVALLAASALAACDRGAPYGGLTLQQALRTDWSDLEVEIVTGMPDDEPGGSAIVFLHGYGRSGTHYAPLAREILDDDSRVFLPTAALPHPGGGGAMWWEFLDEDWPKPYSDDPSARAWPMSRQLPLAREAIARLLGEIRARYRPDRVVLAGHSQGAMLALDVGAEIEPPVDGIAAVAGYLLLDSVPRIETQRGGRPTVLISHGREDELVGFDRAEFMRQVLEHNGFGVVFEPHPGGHGIEPAVVRALRAFLRGPPPDVDGAAG